ncbi:MAG TPA: glycosyltransferase [Longimicrobiales bacterium]|nr:glycosyltransferase [Longimicrobiales bacterium]
MIALLHGYLLDGSGSNLWTQAIARSLCRIGEDVQLVCQERHPEAYDFVAEARTYPVDGLAEVLFRRDTPYPGRCVLHRPELGDTLPVYVPDRYEGFDHVVPMVELSDGAIEDYLRRNVAVVEAVVAETGVEALVANHAVLMSVVARRVAAGRDLPYAVMPHGSALEYAVNPDPRLREAARAALSEAAVVFVIGDEMTRRLDDVFPDLPGLSERMTTLPLGVDVELFQRLPRCDRSGVAGALASSLEGSPRGRRPEQARALAEGVDAAHRAGAPPDAGVLERLWAASSDYALKEPDAGLEDALDRVSWAEDDILLFVGRLIAAKGPQYVIAALPSVLRRRPRARLFLVGHGPLREPLETMVRALDRADEALLRRVVELGGRVEDDPKGPAGFTAVGQYLDDLAARGELADYLESAAAAGIGDRVMFTGYLTHDRLRHLFPAADVAAFPSRVREAGPLVFLEAMAAGVFPLGTYFGGMAASIDATAETLPADAVERMKLRTPDAEAGGIVADIADRAVEALEAAADLGPLLREHVERRHDWRAVAARLRDALSPSA